MIMNAMPDDSQIIAGPSGSGGVGSANPLISPDPLPPIESFPSPHGQHPVYTYFKISM